MSESPTSYHVSPGMNSAWNRSQQSVWNLQRVVSRYVRCREHCISSVACDELVLTRLDLLVLRDHRRWMERQSKRKSGIPQVKKGTELSQVLTTGALWEHCLYMILRNRVCAQPLLWHCAVCWCILTRH